MRGARYMRLISWTLQSSSEQLSIWILSRRMKTLNATYIKTALARFLKVFKEKRPIMAAQEWWLHWDNAPVHTTASVVVRRRVWIRSPTHPIHWTLSHRTFSSYRGWRRSLLARCWPTRASRTAGRGLSVCPTEEKSDVSSPIRSIKMCSCVQFFYAREVSVLESYDLSGPYGAGTWPPPPRAPATPPPICLATGNLVY
jgi:hypothetical protein